jgi:hypothetical protein
MRGLKRAQATAPVSVAQETELGDLRFRGLLSDEDWAALPPSIRRRFSKRLAAGRTTVYVGEVFETWMSKAGWCVAQAARLIGGPLPLARGVHLPSVVTVSEDAATGGQLWTRIYARRAGFPQVVHSFKRFEGPTGLEEHVGWGVGMALTLHVRDDALVFRSTSYFVQTAGLALRAAGLDHPRRAVGDPCRARRRPVQLHAAARAPSVRFAHAADGGVPGARAMT